MMVALQLKGVFMSYILRNPEDITECPMTGAHGGDGTIQVRQVLGDLPGSGLPGFPKDFETPVNFVHIVTLPAGSSIGYHEHANNEEIYYVIKGQATMVCDGETMLMKEGSIFLIKKGSGHAFENRSDQEVVAFVSEFEYSKG